MKTLKDINWNQVYSFYEVARKLSMKEASEILDVSSATLSEQIKKLEKLLGVTLFHRYSRKIELTNEGAALFTCAKEMFEVGGRFLDAVSPNSIGGYTVKVGVQETMSSPIATELLNQYWDLFAPYGTVSTQREFHFEGLIDKLLQGQYDWAVSFERPMSTRLKFQKVASSEIVFCCSPNLFNKFRKKQDIIRSIPLAKCSWDTVLNQKVDDCLREANIQPNEVVASDHLEFIVGLAQRGRCVAILPRSSAEQASWGNTVSLFSLDKPISLDLFAIWPKGSEKMISIRKLKTLLTMSEKPEAMDDPNLQIKVGEVEASLLE